MAIQASIKEKNKQIYEPNDAPDFLDNRDKEPAQIVPPQSNHQIDQVNKSDDSGDFGL